MALLSRVIQYASYVSVAYGGEGHECGQNTSEMFFAHQVVYIPLLLNGMPLVVKIRQI